MVNEKMFSVWKERSILKLYGRGLCEKCFVIAKQEEYAKDIADKAAEAQKLAENADLLLKEAKREAKDRALSELEMERDNLNQEVSELKFNLEVAQKRLTTCQSQLDSTSKKLTTAQKRIEKGASVYKSMVYAMDTFMDQSFDRSELMKVLNIDLSEVLEEEPDLKCLTMKSLRSLYKDNEKRILQITTDYQAKYTTKANIAVYKLMVMALNAEINLILTNLSYGKLDDAISKVKKTTTTYYTIASEGNQTIVNTLNRFIGQIEFLYINAVKIEYEYYVQKERAKEEQRAIREQMRQEAEERKALEAEKKKVENEEKKYVAEMERLQEQINDTTEQTEIERLNARIAELTAKMEQVNERKSEIVNLQNGKAGTVYVISNLGSFGENVFKVGMTRRLDPQDRVNELGDASVPFPFDVHSFIFSEDAPTLETELHRRLNSVRVNKVNLRKEFFNVTIDEIEAMVMDIDPNAPFTKTMLAEQYRQSLSIDEPIVGTVEIDDEELEA